MAKATWVSTTAKQLCDELSARGWVLEQADAEDFVRKARANAAAMTRVTERTAQNYVDESVVKRWAADLMEDHPLGPPPVSTSTDPVQRQRHLRVVQ